MYHLTFNLGVKTLHFNLIPDGSFRGCSKKVPHLLTYAAIMKLGTVIPYPKKIQQTYKSSDAPLEFC